MITVYYRERNYIGDYKCIDTHHIMTADSYFIPEGTSLYYFKTGSYIYKTIAKEDILAIKVYDVTDIINERNKRK